MTETTVTMCDALVASPIDDGQQLACFLLPHPEDPWHYDNRGLGAWFRVVGNTVETRLGLTDHPDSAAPNLPAPLGDSAGHLDLDRLRALLPDVRSGLVDALRSAARDVRAARGTVVVPEDTFDLVRRLTAAGEVLRQWSSAFETAAKEADALTAEEALTAVGEQDGVPLGSLFVPDGEGQRIAVRPDFAAGESVWDVGTLVGWLVDEEVENYGVNLEEDGGWTEAHAKSAAREVVDRLLTLGRYSPSATAIKALRTKLAGQQRDADAGTIGQVRHVGPRAFRGVKITREESK